MTAWPDKWDHRFTEVGIFSSDMNPALGGDARIKALVSLSDEVFATVNFFETSEELYQAICEEFYPGGKIDRLSKEISQIADAPFKSYTANKGVPQDVLLQVQRQIIEGDDAVHLASFSPQFIQKLEVLSRPVVSLSDGSRHIEAF